MTTITFEGTNFNAELLAMKSEQEFLAEFEHTKVYKGFSPEDRGKLLKEAYAKCKEAAQAAGKPVYKEPTVQQAVEELVTEQAPSERPPRKSAAEKAAEK